MELEGRKEYVEELSMHRLTPAQYFAVAQKAALFLQWNIVAVDATSITWYFQPEEFYIVYKIEISIKNKKVLISAHVNDNSVLGHLSPRTYIHRYISIVNKIIAEQEEADRNLHPTNREKYGALIPSKSYLVTPLILYANVFVLVAMLIVGISPIHPDVQSLLKWGGNFKPAVVEGEWWRLVTYMFLHGGVMHLLGNSFALLYIGMFLEPLIGKLRYASAYLLTGVCAGLASIAIHPNSVGVGASGAIFGMYGVFLSLLTTKYIKKTMRKTMLRSILFFIVFNLMMGLQGNTDNAAHIGGLLSGFIIGYMYYLILGRHFKKSRN